MLTEKRLAGALTTGDVADSGWYLELMRDKTDVAYLRDGFKFGKAVAESLRKRPRSSAGAPPLDCLH